MQTLYLCEKPSQAKDVAAVLKINTSFDCRFTSSNKMSCGTISAANTEKDLTVFLNTIPKQAYLIFEACNALLSNCKTASVTIELQ